MASWLRRFAPSRKRSSLCRRPRHDADYDVARTFTRRECRDFVEQAREAFAAWRVVRATVPADAFLVALLAHRRLRG